MGQVLRDLDAASLQQCVELGQIGALQPRREHLFAHMPNLILDLTLLPAGGGRAGYRLNRIVAGNLQKARVVLTLLAREDQMDRGLEVAVDAAPGPPAP